MQLLHLNKKCESEHKHVPWKLHRNIMKWNNFTKPLNSVTFKEGYKCDILGILFQKTNLKHTYCMIYKWKAIGEIVFRRTRRDEVKDGGVLIGTSTDWAEEQHSYAEK